MPSVRDRIAQLENQSKSSVSTPAENVIENEPQQSKTTQAKVAIEDVPIEDVIDRTNTLDSQEESQETVSSLGTDIPEEPALYADGEKSATAAIITKPKPIPAWLAKAPTHIQPTKDMSDQAPASLTEETKATSATEIEKETETQNPKKIPSWLAKAQQPVSPEDDKGKSQTPAEVVDPSLVEQVSAEDRAAAAVADEKDDTSDDVIDETELARLASTSEADETEIARQESFLNEQAPLIAPTSTDMSSNDIASTQDASNKTNVKVTDAGVTATNHSKTNNTNQLTSREIDSVSSVSAPIGPDAFDMVISQSEDNKPSNLIEGEMGGRLWKEAAKVDGVISDSYPPTDKPVNKENKGDDSFKSRSVINSSQFERNDVETVPKNTTKQTGEHLASDGALFVSNERSDVEHVQDNTMKKADEYLASDDDVAVCVSNDPLEAPQKNEPTTSPPLSSISHTDPLQEVSPSPANAITSTPITNGENFDELQSLASEPVVKALDKKYEESLPTSGLESGEGKLRAVAKEDCFEKKSGEDKSQMYADRPMKETERKENSCTFADPTKEYTKFISLEEALATDEGPFGHVKSQRKRRHLVGLMIVTVWVTLVGIIGNVFLGVSCYFAEAPIELGAFEAKIDLHLGLWVYSPTQSAMTGYNYCKRYDENHDAPIIARIFHLSASAAGIFSLSVLWYYLVNGAITSRFWSAAFWCSILATLLQGLVLLFFATGSCTENDCEWGLGSTVVLITAFAWIIMAFELHHQAEYIQQDLSPGSREEDIRVEMTGIKSTKQIGSETSKYTPPAII